MPQHMAEAAGLFPGSRAGGPHRAGYGARAVTLYVAPTGSDSNPGSLARPLATLEAARGHARTIPRGNAAISIILRGGRYLLQRAVQLTQADSGLPGNPVTYAAYPGETPILSGGVQIVNWRLTDPQRNIWTAPLGAVYGVGATPRTFFVNGVRYTRPRYPQPLTGAPVVNNSVTMGLMTSQVNWSALTNPSDMELINYGSWSERRLPVTGVLPGGLDAAGGTTLVLPLVATQIFRNEAGIGTTTLVENVYEYLSAGQFYVNRVSGMISCIPLPGVTLSLSTCILGQPTALTLLSLTGAPGAPVHDITFSGIQFSETGFQMDPVLGYSRLQAGVQSVPAAEQVNYYILANAALEMLYAARITVDSCTFTRLGSHGVKAGWGCVDVRINGNLLFDVSGVGVYAGNPILSQSDADKLSRITLQNNALHHLGAEFSDCPAIQQFWSEDTEIAHNTVSDMPYSGINVGWGSPLPLPGWQVNLKVHHNRVLRVMLVRRDGGGIYSTGRSTNEQITDNAVTDIPIDFGIYIDDSSIGKIVARNALYAIHNAYLNLNDPAGVNFVAGNVMDSLQISVANGVRTPPGTVQVTSPQTIVPISDPAMQAIVAAAGVQPAYRALLGKGAAIS